MSGRRSAKQRGHANTGSHQQLHDWVSSLPWVVERDVATGWVGAGARSFGVDCEPLGRRRVWLVTGLEAPLDPFGTGIVVIVPHEDACVIEQSGLGRAVAPLRDGQAMVALRVGEDDPQRLERLVLRAYSLALD